VNYNSENDWYFPSRGARFNAEYAYLTDNFAKLDGKVGMSEVSADWRMSFPFSSRFTLQPMLYGRLLLGSSFPPVFGNAIGGDWFDHYVEQQMPFAGIGNMEYVEREFVAAQLQAQQHIGLNSYVLVRVAVAQQANKLKNLLDNRTLIGAQAAYYYKTMFGPVGATLGYSNRTEKPYFFVNLGYEF
jgi:NTE family protein